MAMSLVAKIVSGIFDFVRIENDGGASVRNCVTSTFNPRQKRAGER